MAQGEFDQEDFEAYYRFSPAALALREAVRLSAVREIELPEPILDVGCGDGLFAQLAYPDRQIWGIDINATEVRRAQATDSYKTLICGDVRRVNLPGEFFGSAIANCSLEHVPDLPEALRNIRSSLKPGAVFVLIVPTPDWTRKLALPVLLRRLGLEEIGDAYGDALDAVFNHETLEDDSWWSERLAEADFETLEVRPIVSRATSWLFEMLLPSSTLGYLTKKVTGRWIVAPKLRKSTSWATQAMLRSLYWALPEASDEMAGEYLMICKAK